jgi:hypothetical protein
MTEQETKAAQEAELRLAYGHTFTGPKGEAVLKDLRARFGFKGTIEQPSAVPGMRNEEVWMREGMKQPMRHILAMMAKPEQEPRPQTAQSGTNP